jgi:hypothetical protein
MEKEQEKVLGMLESGQITAQEALQLLDALDATDPLPDTSQSSAPPLDLPETAHWWRPIALAGLVIMAIGAPLMTLGLIGQTALFWAISCGWLPFFVGLAILTLGAWSHSARWLHLRIVHTGEGHRSFTLSLPLPLTLTAWVLKLIRPFVPQLQETGIDEVVLAAQEELKEGADDCPVYLNVQDDQGDEQILLYIG